MMKTEFVKLGKYDTTLQKILQGPKVKQEILECFIFIQKTCFQPFLKIFMKETLSLYVFKINRNYIFTQFLLK